MTHIKGMRASFRDPAGKLIRHDNKIIRWIAPESEDAFRLIESSSEIKGFISRNSIIPYDRVDGDLSLNFAGIGKGGVWVEHPRIAFPTYPEEWTFGMLKAAASLSLELADAILADGLELKDCTPYNVLFRGAEPTFVDLLSFTPFTGRSVWGAYGQCLRTFMLPLWLCKDFGLRLDRLFLCEREGISPEEAGRLVGLGRKLLPPYLYWLAIPGLLAKFLPAIRESSLEVEVSKRLHRMRIRSLVQALSSCRRHQGSSNWTEYTADRNYGDSDLAGKLAMVCAALDGLGPNDVVLDVGANTGEFSVLAAQRGMQVVSLDSDEQSLDLLWEKARTHGYNILPLVMNIARPTPATGWKGEEQISFMDRASGAFDLILALAVIHHLRFTEGVPLALQVDLFSTLTKGRLLVEWVGTKDERVVELIRRFGYLPADYTKAQFEAALEDKFQVLSHEQVGQTDRWIYLCEKR
ncbi:class I SAM-dependent methyltransferase [Mesoterricola silvestris]|uniref:50S ribosomal protein L11 methyltransferase n=1 Tax=Mesoterricola silvestris TaxID=2927979 RepID=A0AA48GHJ3_9BACT|nr:class I SAM-dependent methyltransferase [Mesoterricola silvestris]BDU71079.1 50S ribosomal protein L11 methyltransferase [Mesoterricola silvestris]